MYSIFSPILTYLHFVLFGSELECIVYCGVLKLLTCPMLYILRNVYVFG